MVARGCFNAWLEFDIRQHLVCCTTAHLQGRGKYGALGLGDFENRSVPTLVHSLAGVAIRQVSCGDDHTVLLAEGGAVYTMGR